MTPYYADDWLSLYGGDCLDVLREMPADSVDCVVTSPPYWGLRDYGTATWAGGDAECNHEPSQEWIDHNFNANSAFGNGTGTQSAAAKARWYRPDGSCRCGATRIDSQLGLERTPEEYVANMVAVFREVRRVLRPSGTCWLNLGDSYWGGKGTNGTSKALGNAAERGFVQSPGTLVTEMRPQDGRHDSIKPKDLVGIPWRVAFALQADGWYLRSDIIWSKPNPMPESVTDRPTKSHEYLFLITKSPRYYFDADAVRETAIYEGVTVKASNPDTAKNGAKGKYGATAFGFTQHDTVVAGRNIRSVWTIANRPYPGAHFAVFPPELPERCIKAGSPEGGVVLDPFGGSGTVGMVANRLSRRAILIDLNPEYLEQQMKRNAQTPLGLGVGSRVG